MKQPMQICERIFNQITDEPGFYAWYVNKYPNTSEKHFEIWKKCSVEFRKETVEDYLNCELYFTEG